MTLNLNGQHAHVDLCRRNANATLLIAAVFQVAACNATAVPAEAAGVPSELCSGRDNRERSAAKPASYLLAKAACASD
jgi:hypothetical protein